MSASKDSQSSDGDDKKQRPRSHRKTHGMGFAGLAKNIAAKWKNLDDEARSQFDSLASVDKARYRKEVEEWKSAQKIKKEQEKIAHQEEEHESMLAESQVPSMPLSVPSAAPAPGCSDGNDHSMPFIPSTPNSNLFMIPQNFPQYKLPTLQSTLVSTNFKSMIAPTRQHHPTTSLRDMLFNLEPTSLEAMVASSSEVKKVPMMAAALFNSASQSQPPNVTSSADDKAWGNLEAMLDEALDVTAMQGIPEPVASAGLSEKFSRRSSTALPSSLALDNFEETLDTDLKDFLATF